MKKLLILIGMLAALLGMGAQAQTAPETWQGTLHAGRDLRLVLQVTKVDGALKGKIFSIDQGPGGMTTTTMSIDGGVLKFAITGMDMSYEGKLSPDGKSATGTWKQGGRETPLVLEHVSADAAWEIPKATPALSLMDPKLTPGYEVATIKPSRPDEQGRGFTLQGRHLVARNFTVEGLITLAYNLHSTQVMGGPDWIKKDHFDMDVLPDHEGLPSLEQARGIVRKLLADRFALKFHDDTKVLPVYVLSVAKSGPKLTKSASDPNSPPGMGGPPGRMMMRNGTMAEFAQVMQGILDRPVLDQTELKDRYDLTMRWTPDDSQYGGRVPPQNSGDNAANADAPPPLFTAIQEQIGLKLDAVKAPAKVMVIESVNQPSAN
ncbi:TIGR03435 family protein [Edaphobacter acidisoli]|uniref:TIGR03435 family protein n=1 Tax=Edaphobacter acidisoli TaxID=2040573 RepID=UPI00166B262B|nr:TIGR03435 family protein [Edaphobacter acidisoli]